MRIKQHFTEDGFSLVELIVALTLAVLAIISAFQVFTAVTTSQYQSIKATADIEDSAAAFNLFLSYYNQSKAVADVTAATNTAVIENKDTDLASAVALTFGAALDVTGTQAITLPLNFSSASGVTYSYQVFPAVGPNVCSFTASGAAVVVATATGCPTSDINTVARAVLVAGHTFMVALSTGSICKITAIGDTNALSFELCTQSELVAANSFFYPPRLVFYSNDGLFTRSIMESFGEPRQN